jgi:hypothetical protein
MCYAVGYVPDVDLFHLVMHHAGRQIPSHPKAGKQESDDWGDLDAGEMLPDASGTAGQTRASTIAAASAKQPSRLQQTTTGMKHSLHAGLCECTSIISMKWMEASARVSILSGVLFDFLQALGC